MTLQYDPSFFEKAKDLLAFISARPAPRVHDVQARRDGLAAFFGPLCTATPTPSDIQHSQLTFSSFDGVEITIQRFAKKESQSSPGPAIVHFHGGGMIAGSAEMFRPFTAQNVSLSGVQMFSIEYRLAPEHPYPTPIEDCYAGLQWVRQHASEYNIDPTRIAVMGESAGGGLAAGVALMARDRQFSPPLAKQILIYPMLDAKNVKAVTPELEKYLFWTVSSNMTGWSAYLGDKVNSDEIPPYASPTHVKSVKGLPPTYIDVGGLDLFRDECIEYAARLARADIPVEFHLYPGVPHAFEGLGMGSEPQLLSGANRIRALKGF